MTTPTEQNEQTTVSRDDQLRAAADQARALGMEQVARAFESLGASTGNGESTSEATPVE